MLALFPWALSVCLLHPLMNPFPNVHGLHHFTWRNENNYQSWITWQRLVRCSLSSSSLTVSISVTPCPASLHLTAFLFPASFTVSLMWLGDPGDLLLKKKKLLNYIESHSVLSIAVLRGWSITQHTCQSTLLNVYTWRLKCENSLPVVSPIPMLMTEIFQQKAPKAFSETP